MLFPRQLWAAPYTKNTLAPSIFPIPQLISLLLWTGRQSTGLNSSAAVFSMSYHQKKKKNLSVWDFSHSAIDSEYRLPTRFPEATLSRFVSGEKNFSYMLYPYITGIRSPENEQDPPTGLCGEGSEERLSWSHTH